MCVKCICTRLLSVVDYHIDLSTVLIKPRQQMQCKLMVSIVICQAWIIHFKESIRLKIIYWCLANEVMICRLTWSACYGHLFGACKYAPPVQGMPEEIDTLCVAFRLSAHAHSTRECTRLAGAYDETSHSGRGFYGQQLIWKDSAALYFVLMLNVRFS